MCLIIVIHPDNVELKWALQLSTLTDTYRNSASQRTDDETWRSVECFYWEFLQRVKVDPFQLYTWAGKPQTLIPSDHLQTLSHVGVQLKAFAPTQLRVCGLWEEKWGARRNPTQTHGEHANPTQLLRNSICSSAVGVITPEQGVGFYSCDCECERVLITLIVPGGGWGSSTDDVPAGEQKGCWGDISYDMYG